MKQKNWKLIILPESYKAGKDREGEGETEAEDEVGRDQVNPGAQTSLVGGQDDI